MRAAGPRRPPSSSEGGGVGVGGVQTVFGFFLFFLGKREELFWFVFV